jgi:hypothetical protein
MRHETFHDRSAQAMLMAARAGSPRWSVRELDAFDDPEALAFARLVEGARPGATGLLLSCAAWLRRRRESGEPLQPLPLLVLNEDGRPVMLLPMVLRERNGLRHVLPARGTAGVDEPPRPAPPLTLPGLALSALEARAVLHAIMAKLAGRADLLTIALPRPGTHALTWRGLFHLLRRRLRGETARD